MALSRVHTWSAGEILLASDLNAEFNNPLTNALTMISPLTANLAAGGFKITGLGAASVAGDSLRVDDIQVQLATAFTTGGTATAFTLTPTPAITANTKNQRFRVKFNAASGTTPTLAVSGQTAKNLKYYDSAAAKQAITATQVPINWISDVEYDGTDWMVLQVTSASSNNTLSDADNATTYSVAALAGFPVGVLILTNNNTRTVTNFTGGIEGQVLIVINEGGAAVVTIDRSNAYLFGGANQTLSAHNAIMLMKHSTLWYQIAPVSTSA